MAAIASKVRHGVHQTIAVLSASCEYKEGKSTRGAELKTIPELGLPRRVLACLPPARSQHGNFAEYRERFHVGQATLECLYRH
ncbi:hypothetical protein MY4038_008446 [Beauveria bassiana]